MARVRARVRARAMAGVRVRVGVACGVVGSLVLLLEHAADGRLTRARPAHAKHNRARRGRPRPRAACRRAAARCAAAARAAAPTRGQGLEVLEALLHCALRLGRSKANVAQTSASWLSGGLLAAPEHASSDPKLSPSLGQPRPASGQSAARAALAPHPGHAGHAGLALDSAPHLGR